MTVGEVDGVRLFWLVVEGLMELGGVDFVVVRRVEILVLDLIVLEESLSELPCTDLLVNVVVVFLLRTVVVVIVLRLVEEHLFELQLLGTILLDVTLCLVDEVAPHIEF